jgi:protein-tyrosine phosphatase
LLAEGREAAAKRVGDAQAWHMVRTRPRGIIDDVPVEDQPALPERLPNGRRPLWKRMFGNA